MFRETPNDGVQTSPDGRDEKQAALKSWARVHAGTWFPTQSSRMRGGWSRYRPVGCRLAAVQRSGSPGLEPQESPSDGSCRREREDVTGETGIGSWTRQKFCCMSCTDQRQQGGVEVLDGAAGVHGEHAAAQLQPLVDGAPQTRQQNLALPQAVDEDGESSQEPRKNQLQTDGGASDQEAPPSAWT